MIIETTSFDEKLRFKIDLLAEYLAAMHLVEENGSNEDKWCVFIDVVFAGQKLSGRRPEFLMAIRECCMVEKQQESFVWIHFGKADKAHKSILIVLSRVRRVSRRGGLIPRMRHTEL
jgi:hypothetical protein